MPVSRLNPSAKASLAELNSPDHPTFYLKLARTFLKVSDDYVLKLTAEKIPDASTLKEIGHIWKSNAYAMGATELGDLCTRLETANTDEPNELDSLIISIKHEYQLVRAELVSEIASYPHQDE